MTTRYVHLKSQLTANKESYESCGCRVYRTRTACACVGKDNRRDAILIIDTDNVLVETVVRCKACANPSASLVPFAKGDIKEKGGAV